MLEDVIEGEDSKKILRLNYLKLKMNRGCKAGMKVMGQFVFAHDKTRNDCSCSTKQETFLYRVKLVNNGI